MSTFSRAAVKLSHRFLAPVAALLLPVSAQAIDTSAWQFEQTLSISAPGLQRVDVVLKAPVALPSVPAEGAHIDLANWRYRKPISVGQTGVIRVELDAGTLAHAQTSLDDLRLIQKDKQIPFLVEHTQ